MKKNRNLIMIFGMIVSMISCEGEDSFFTAGNNSEFDDKNVTCIDDIQNLYNYIYDRIPSQNQGKNEEFDLIETKANIFPDIEYGYTTCTTGYAGLIDAPIYVRDFLVAEKLGIKANQTYYMTTMLVEMHYSLQPSWRPGVANSPYCGLLMNNITEGSNNPTSLHRGYKGVKKGNLFIMSTHIVFFRKNAGDNYNTIYYPCSPSTLQWNINIMVL